MNINFLDKIGTLSLNILPFIIVLTVIVFIHELGHFLIARYNGVQVKTFSIGYGSELWGWTDKKGTRWRISALPIGGYVMMLGDSDVSSVKADLKNLAEEDKNKTVHTKTPFQRMMVALGGPLFNVIFTILIFMAIGIWKGIPDMVPKIQEISKYSLAEKSGLKAGDIITGFNENTIKKVSEMKKFLTLYKGQDVTLRYKRNQQETSTRVGLYEFNLAKEKIPLDVLGISLSGEMIFEKVSLGKAFYYGVQYCYISTCAIIKGLTKMIKKEEDGAKVGSILSIGSGANQAISQGFVPFLIFMAMLSFNLGFFNMLPIPVLDGGSIFLNLIEIIIRRPLSEIFVNVVYMIGIGLVGLLMVWSLWNDFLKYGLIDQAVQFFKTFFHF